MADKDRVGILELPGFGCGGEFVLAGSTSDGTTVGDVVSGPPAFAGAEAAAG